MSYSNINNLEEIRNKKILFYDLETTGIIKTPRGLKPEEEYPDYKDLKKYDNTRIISIGWIFMDKFDYDYEIGIENISENIIKPNGFIIPNESINIHGITNDEANNKGKDIKKVLKKIGKIIKKCDYIVGYNIYYDINVLLSELHRKKRNITIKKILKLKEEEKIICIGQISSKEAKPKEWKQKNNYQIPKLMNVYKKCFNEDLINAHNAKSDVLGMIKIIYWIYENTQINKNINNNYSFHNMKIKQIFNGRQANDYDENGFPEYGNDDYSMCGYGKPTKIKEYYECLDCYTIYIITSSAGRDACDGDYNDSNGLFYNCNECKKKLDRHGIRYDNDNIIYNKIRFKILGYNLFCGESPEQIDFIEKMNNDILFLSETSKNSLNNFKDYKGYCIKSHCGYTYLGINKKFKIEELKLINSIGIILLYTKIDNTEVILGSIHLAPGKENANVRDEQLKNIITEIKKINLNNIPVILGGDTNMKDNININEFDLNDVYLIKKESKYELTYPNRTFKDERLKFIPKYDYRYDRFFIKNCKCLCFETIGNNDSDHLSIITYVEL